MKALLHPFRAAVFFLLTLFPCAAFAADGFIYIDISVKFIAFPGDGGRPRTNRNDINSRITDAQIQTALDDANRFLASYQRGYRLRLLPLETIGGSNQSHANRTRIEPGYYAIQSTDANPLTFAYPPGYIGADGNPRTTGPLIDVLDQNARTNAATKLAFKWNDNAVNIFVVTEWGGGGGIFPQWGSAAGFGFFEGWLFLHEVSHYFDLYHTFQGDSANDFVTDTLVDPNSITQDGVAMSFYSKSYSQLTGPQLAVVDAEYARRARDSIAAANNTPPNDVLSSSIYSSLPAGEKELVDNVFFNLMSYYDPFHRNDFVTRITEGQLDRFADNCNFVRHSNVTGYTRFISPAGNDVIIAGILNGGTKSTLPLRTVSAGVARAAADSGDDEILLLSPGSYNEPMTIATPCTLRATRKGPVVIGKP